ncbi:MAG: hypothetical protein Q8Q09_20175 [Deltaproteobacteria bacterium]|nr:hypothetical protein [Deltaproteobacteria bacterium]
MSLTQPPQTAPSPRPEGAHGLRRFAVGAHFACFYCRERSYVSGHCPRCHRLLLDLRRPDAQGPLVRLARRVARANQLRAGLHKRENKLAMVGHACAMAGAILGAVFAPFIVGPQSSLAMSALMVGLGILLGAALGYLALGLAMIALLLATAGCALMASLWLILFAGFLYLFASVVPGDPRRVLRGRIERRTLRMIQQVFSPVFYLRGDHNRGWESRPRHEGLRPVALPLVIPTTPERAIKATLVSGSVPAEFAHILQTTAPLVLVEGCTLGARVRDALVAHFSAQTSDGDLIEVEMLCGEVLCERSPDAPRHENVSLAELGIAKSFRKPEELGEASALAVESVDLETEVLFEGGQFEEHVAHAGASNYRTGAYQRTLRGTPEFPLRITVLSRPHRSRT